MDSTSQNTTGHLPPDLLRETLSRLPVKSLLRFRSVSKPWQALVDSDSVFAHWHLSTLNNIHGRTRLLVLHHGCFIWRRNSLKPVPVTPPRHSEWSIVTSVDGLVLIRLYYRTKSSDFKLWSPSLRQFRDLPRFPPDIGLTPIVEETVLGFGYDPLAKDYKLVKIISSDARGTEIAIYTIGLDSWKIIPYQGQKKRRGWVASFSTCVCLHGKLYTVCTSLKKENDWDLVVFDLSNEVFSYVRSPKSICCSERKELGLVDGGSSVAIFSYNHKDSIWVLKRETMNWRRRRGLSDEERFHSPILATSLIPYAESLILHQYNAKSRFYNVIDKKEEFPVELANDSTILPNLSVYKKPFSLKFLRSPNHIQSRSILQMLVLKCPRQEVHSTNSNEEEEALQIYQDITIVDIMQSSIASPHMIRGLKTKSDECDLELISSSSSFSFSKRKTSGLTKTNDIAIT